MVFLSDFLLLCLDLFALRTLVSSIFLHESQSAVSLRETLCAEDEHQFVLYGAVLRHILHRLLELFLPVLELRLQGRHLRLQHADIAIKFLYFQFEAVDVFLLGIYLAIDDEEIAQAGLHIGLIGLQPVLLGADVLFYLLSLTLQATNL